MDCFYGGFSVAYEFQQSRRGHRLAKCLFGSSSLTFDGSDFTSTGTCTNNCGTLLGDNFGISPFSSGTISFNPRIRTNTIEFQVYLGLDEWWNGLWFAAYAPVTHAKWDLRTRCGTSCSNNCSSNGCSTSCSSNGCSSNGCSTNCSSNDCSSSFSSCNSGCDSLTSCSLVTTPFPAGCIGPVTGATGGLVTGAATIQQALSGDFLFGAMQESWRFGRFGNCSNSDWKLADLNLQLGWDFWNCEDYHLGLFLQVFAPTGTKLDECWARNVFSPVIGNGHHWEVGGGITAHAELWNCNDDHSITAYLDGHVTHMLKRCQVRSFDFTDGGCLSRYSLLREFTSTAGVYAPTGGLINAINFTTRRADVKIAVKGDATLRFIYNHCGWSAGIGYNIYGRSREDVCIKGGLNDIDSRFFGLRGCNPVEVLCFDTAFVGGVEVTTSAATPTLLGATSSNATINCCGTTDSPVDLVTPAVIGGAAGSICVNTCNPALVTPVTVGTAVAGLLPFVATDSLTTDLTAAPVLVTASSLDKRSGEAARQITNKVFGTLDYTWMDCDWSPYLGVGAEIELASCKNACSVNQWGVWLKGGVSF